MSIKLNYWEIKPGESDTKMVIYIQRKLIMLLDLFLVRFFLYFFSFVGCGRLSWIVSFSLHVKYTISYRSINALRNVLRKQSTENFLQKTSVMQTRAATATSKHDTVTTKRVVKTEASLGPVGWSTELEVGTVHVEGAAEVLCDSAATSKQEYTQTVNTTC